jgi:DNA-binding LytR/AlgR family response regulator
MIVLSPRVEADAVVLIVENNIQHITWFKEICKKMGFLEKNIRVEREISKARDAIDSFKADVVILDLATANSPRNPGPGASELEKWQGDFAVIVVTNYPEAIDKGRQAYTVIRKPPEPGRDHSARRPSNPDPEKRRLKINDLELWKEETKEKLEESFREERERFRAQEMERFREQVRLAIFSALEIKHSRKTFRTMLLQKLNASKFQLTIPFGAGTVSTPIKWVTFFILVILPTLIVLLYSFWHKLPFRFWPK